MKKLKFKINKIFNYIFGEKFYKKLDFYWDNLPKRYDLINRIIEKKKYENYLEIGCDDNHTFDQIKMFQKKCKLDSVCCNGRFLHFLAFCV